MQNFMVKQMALIVEHCKQVFRVNGKVCKSLHVALLKVSVKGKFCPNGLVPG